MRVLLAGGLSLLAMNVYPQTQSAGQDFEGLLHRAFQFHQQGNYPESLPLLREAFKFRPGDYFVNLLLGIDLLRTGNPADAIGFLNTAARLRPKEEFPHEYLGEAHAHMGEFSQAVKQYGGAVRIAPTSEQAVIAFVDFSLARFGKILAELRASRPGLAAEYRIEAQSYPLSHPNRRDFLQKAVELDDQAPGVWGELALAHIAAGDLPAAERDLQKAAAADPDDLLSIAAQALVAAMKQQWQDATAHLNFIAHRSRAVLVRVWLDWPAELIPSPNAGITGPARAFFSCIAKGKETCDPQDLIRNLPQPEIKPGASRSLLFREQRWEQVAAQAEPLPEDRQAWFERGVALAATGNCGAALPALEKANKGLPASVQNLYWLSVCYAQTVGEVADSIWNSNDELVHVMRGDIFLRLRANGPAALAEYQTALAKRPQDPAILERVAEAQRGVGQMDAARENALAALRYDPHRLGAQRTLAEIALEQRDDAGALPYLRELASRDPQDAVIQVELGTACAQTGALEEALRNLGPLLERGYPDQKGTLHYLLGTVLRKLGRTAEAQQAFASAHELSDRFQHSSQEGENGQH